MKVLVNSLKKKKKYIFYYGNYVGLELNFTRVRKNLFKKKKKSFVKRSGLPTITYFLKLTAGKFSSRYSVWSYDKLSDQSIYVLGKQKISRHFA